MPKFRTLIEEARFAQEAAAIQSDARRMDEILHAVTWALSRDATIGQQTGIDDVWAVPVDESPLGPALVIYYTFTRDEVHLLCVRRADVDTASIAAGMGL